MITAPFPVGNIFLITPGFQTFFQDAYDNEGGVLRVRIRSAVEGGGNLFQKFRSTNWGTEAERPQWVVTYHVPILTGYKLYLKPSVAPNPDVDQPVATVGSSALSAVLDMAALGLMPNSGYFGLVSPFNTVGRADASAPFGFRTDGAGMPLIVPAPASELTAVPLVGGNVRVAWTYDEPNPIAVADTFEIEVFNDTSSFPFSVPHAAPRRTHTRDLAIGGDGLFQVRVKSDKGGLSEANVSPVPVMLDATPPAVVPVTLSAVE